MKKNPIYKWCLMAGLAISLGACSSNTFASDDNDDDDVIELTSSFYSSASESISCKSVKEPLAAPTNFSASNDNDTTWILSWEYNRNDSRAETGFEIEMLDMDSSSPEWVTEGTTNADVTFYKLKGMKKIGKYYRVYATDKCGRSKESNRIHLKRSL